jgi:uncharacterized protein
MNEREKFKQGIEHFNSRQFFEAHEVWEDLWLGASEPEKTFLQGLIQVAAAFHHHSRGNIAGTKSLLLAGTTKLQGFPENHSGLALGELRLETQQWIEALGAGEDCARRKVPRIHGHGGPKSHVVVKT